MGRPKGCPHVWQDVETGIRRCQMCSVWVARVSVQGRGGKRREVERQAPAQWTRGEVIDWAAGLGGELREEDPKRPAKPPSVSDWCVQWLASKYAEVEASQIKAQSVRAYERDCAHLCASIGGLRLDDIRRSDLDRYRLDLTRHLAPRTQIAVWSISLAVLKAGWADYRLLDVRHAALEGLRPPKPATEKAGRALCPEEVARLLEAAARQGLPVQTFIEALVFTGARQGELRTRRPADLDVGAGTLRVVEGKTASAARTLYLPPWLAERIGQQAAHGGAWIWHVQRDPSKPWCPSYATDLVARVAEAAGLGWVTPHDLRRTANTHLVQSGVPESFVREVLGHVDASMTRLYLRPSAVEAKAALSPLWDRYAGPKLVEAPPSPTKRARAGGG